MNVSLWVGRLRHHIPSWKRGCTRVASFAHALAQMVNRNTCIIVRVVPGGFAVILRPSALKRELRAQWHEESSCWQPESSFRHILHAASGRPVELELPPELTLQQSIKIPEVALKNLSDAVVYGLPTWSPFEAHEVYVVGSVDKVQAGQASVNLHYALRMKLDPLLARLAAIGLPADRVLLGSAVKQPVTLATPKLVRIRKTRRIDGALAVTAISLALLLGLFRLMILTQRVESVETLLRSEFTEFRKTNTLQANYASFAARRAIVAQRRAKEVSVYEFLLAFAQHLPDRVTIQTLEINGSRGRVSLIGMDSDAATKALGIIPVIHNLNVEASRGPDFSAVKFDILRSRI